MNQDKNHLIIDDEIHRIEVINGVIHGVYHPNLETIDLRTAQKLVRDRKEISCGKTLPVYIDLSRFVSITKDAREFMASSEAVEGLSAVGILLKTWIHKSIANFWYSINKPKVPTKMFNEKEDVLKWLESFKN